MTVPVWDRQSTGWTPLSDNHNALRLVDRKAWQVLMELYARVRRKAAAMKTSRGTLYLEAGQCVFGYDEIAACTGLTVSAVRCATRRMVERYGFVTVDGTSLGSIATIRFVQEFQNPKSHRTRYDKHAANEQQLTDTEKTNTADVATSSSSSPDNEDLDPRIVALHEAQESLRRRHLGASYKAIPIRDIAGLIEQRLADYTPEECECVLRADAEEVSQGSNARFFGTNTWSAKNFSIKMPRQRQVEAEREQRKPPHVPWKRRCDREQRKLDGMVRLHKVTEGKELVANYSEFSRRFHKHKGTWPQVRHHWDRVEKTWSWPGAEE